MAAQIWTHEQFESMSWHDNHVHGLRMVAGEHGSGQLVLDLDYILEWLCGRDGYQFKIAPVSLTFFEVTDLRISLDYATPTAALGPFSIAAVERREQSRERYVATIWKIVVNWPHGEIEFEAKGFEQRALGAPVFSDEQFLRPEVRGTRA